MADRSFCRRPRISELLCVLLAGVGLAGCALPNMAGPQTAGPCLGGGTAVVQDAFQVSVSDVRWTDRVMRAGMEQIPEAQRAMHGEQAYLRPQAEFLVVDLQITNITKQPVAWANVFATYGKSYKLITKDGVVYEFSPQASSLMYATVGGNINPGMSARGPIVFDVPRGNYDFVIEHTSFAGYGALTRYFTGSEVFRCSLPPA